MLRITKLTDYAIVVLADLAAHPKAQGARGVAERTQIPLPTVSKVLKRLARGGVCISERGSKGGYRLSRLATQINLAEIIDAVEGPIAVTECTHDALTCELEGSCRVEQNWIRINDVVRRALEGVCLAEMCRQPEPPLVTLRKGLRPLPLLQEES